MQQERLKKLLAEAAQTTVSGPLALDPQAVSILTEYAEEITSRILESAILLSQAKGAQVIEDADIALLLGLFSNFFPFLAAHFNTCFVKFLLQLRN